MTRNRAPGLSILEVMVAMAILLVGLLGMMRLQIFGITSNAMGRMHTGATALAQELAAGLERLPFGDALISANGTPGPDAPEPFGRLVVGQTLDAAEAHEWDDDDPVPGVRLSDAAGPQYERRWTVWGYSPSSGALPAVKIVAVSVVYREPIANAPREVVIYTQLYDSGALVSNIPANQ